MKTYHEMHYVSGLPYGEFPYEERFPTNRELKQLEKLLSTCANTYWEVICHLNVCMDLYERRKRGLLFAKWARYLVTDLRLPKMLKVSSLLEVEVRVADLGN